MYVNISLFIIIYLIAIALRLMFAEIWTLFQVGLPENLIVFFGNYSAGTSYFLRTFKAYNNNTCNGLV